MNIRPAILILLVFGLLLETTIFTFPIVYILVLALYIMYPDLTSIIAAFIAGLVLDMLKVSPIGITPLFIIISVIALELFKRGFELKDYRITLTMLLIASFIYAKIFTYTENVLPYVLTFGSAFFLIYYFRKKSLW